MSDDIGDIFGSVDNQPDMASLMAKKITERKAGKVSSELSGGPSPDDLFKERDDSVIPLPLLKEESYIEEDFSDDGSVWVIGFYIPNPVKYGVELEDIHVGTIEELKNDNSFRKEALDTDFSFSELEELENQDLNQDLTVLALREDDYISQFGPLGEEDLGYKEQLVRREKPKRIQESKSLEEQTINILKQILVELKKK